MSKLGNFYGLSDIDIQKRFCFCIRNFRFGENKVNYSYCIRSLLKKHILSCYLKTDFMSKRHRGGEINGVLNIGGRRYFTSFKNVCNYQCEMSLFVVSLFGFGFFFRNLGLHQVQRTNEITERPFQFRFKSSHQKNHTLYSLSQ